jgi:uncharacterized protein YlxP (DUF503 family)
MDDVRTHTGTLIADLVLDSARTLKDRRGPQRALLQRLRNAEYNAAQVGPADLIQRWFLAVAVVSGDATQVDELLDAAERIIFASEFEVAELRRRTHTESYRSAR